MDSVTQAALGAGIAGAFAPRGHKRKALLMGAALGTLPDLDVFIDFGDAVDNFTKHRGFSHSLFVLIPLSVLLWWALQRFWKPAREAPLAWFLAVSLALVTHPLLDAHTAYGTQLFWPLESPPVMWATLFIIDPLFTLPLLAGVFVLLLAPHRNWATPLVNAALALSCCYLAWSWVAQGTVRQNARDSLVSMGLEDAPVFITPAPFNTLLWRIVVLTPEGYLEGFDSLLLDEPDPGFTAYTFDRNLLEDAARVPAVQRLNWFSQGFVRASIDQNRQLLIGDLRMGQEPYYVFTHAVAREEQDSWRPMETVLMPFSYDQRLLPESFRRIHQVTNEITDEFRDRPER